MLRTTLVMLLTAIGVFAQDQKPPAPFVSPSARLMSAKTAYMSNGGGSEIPYNVIEEGMQGWGRFTLADSPQKADIIVEVTAPEEDNGVSVSTSSDSGGHSSSRSSRDLTVAIIKLIVYDAKTHLPLWSSNERPKNAFKERAREDNLVQASEKLLSRFRDRLEPPPAK